MQADDTHTHTRTVSRSYALKHSRSLIKDWPFGDLSNQLQTGTLSPKPEYVGATVPTTVHNKIAFFHKIAVYFLFQTREGDIQKSVLGIVQAFEIHTTCAKNRIISSVFHFFSPEPDGRLISNFHRLVIIRICSIRKSAAKLLTLPPIVHASVDCLLMRCVWFQLIYSVDIS